MASNNVPKILSSRQIHGGNPLKFEHRLHVTRNMVNRLGLEAELVGHGGCVNCVEWNERGDLLASGSDDRDIILWDPFLRKKLHSIPSGHEGNLFSVKFLQNSIISASADFRIRIHDIISQETIMSCHCHGSRVKRIAVTPSEPFIFWSASEDGIIMQYDTRVEHECANVCSNVLINLVSHLGRTAEAKCIAINRWKPELLAVGANDPYVRLYDRRMIKPTVATYPRPDRAGLPWVMLAYPGEPVISGIDNLPSTEVSYFVPGHLPLKHVDSKKHLRTLTTTYVAFSPDGNELLANLGGEQIYLFNIQSKRVQMAFDATDFSQPSKLLSSSVDGCLDGTMSSMVGSADNNHSNEIILSCSHHENHSYVQTPYHKWSSLAMSKKFEDLMQKAMDAVHQRKYSLAIGLYSEGLILFPKVVCLYGNRAAAYIKRGWNGDCYAASRDCYVAMKLDPGYFTVFFRLAQCLHRLHWFKESLECLKAIKTKFPLYARTTNFEVFEAEVKIACFADMEIQQPDTESQGQASASSENAATNSVNRRRTNSRSLPIISDKERAWRSEAYDYEIRFCGHCNNTTDIKEANFFGNNGQHIVAGSDDGYIFIWDRVTTSIVKILRGDDAIVNCVQPHPTSCLLATSGIDPVVRLWGPKAEDGSKDGREIENLETVANDNHRRMNTDPVQVMLLNMGYDLPNDFVRDAGRDLLPDMFQDAADPGGIQCPTS